MGLDIAPSRLLAADVLRVASVGLRTRRLRAALSALGVAIGIAAMVAVLGISDSSKAGLVAEEGLKEDARVRIYRARPIALEPVQEWLWAIEDLWRRQLDSFKTYAESNRPTRRTRS